MNLTLLTLALAGVGGRPPAVGVPLEVVTRGPLQDPPDLQAEVGGEIVIDGRPSTGSSTTIPLEPGPNHPSKRDEMVVSHYGGATFLRNDRPMPDPGRRSIPPWARGRGRR